MATTKKADRTSQATGFTVDLEIDGLDSETPLQVKAWLEQILPKGIGMRVLSVRRHPKASEAAL